VSDLDLLVRGGTVVTPSGRARLDLAVADGRIVEIGALGADVSAARVVDADGLLVLPGMVDTHVHLMDPGDPTREDLPTGTRAALVNGVTTIVEHTHGWPVTTLERLEEKREHLAGRIHTDTGLAAHAWPEHLDEIGPLWRGGVAFFKIFTCATHGVPAMTADLLLDAFRRIADVDGAALVHSEDDLITAAAEARLRAAGRDDNAILPQWRSREAEQVAVATVALLSRITGARVTIAHASTPAVLDLIMRERRLGAPVVAESCPQYLFLREAEVLHHGTFRKFTPPARARSAADEEEMWRRFNVGDITLLSTDHAPSTPAQKRDGGIWEAHFGLPGLDSTFALMLDAALSGRTSLELVTDRYARAPARRYRLAGKGELAAGKDADILLIDPDAVRTLRNEDVISRAGWTPYDGREVRGAVVATFLRGVEVARAGAVTTDSPRGRFLPGPGAVRS